MKKYKKKKTTLDMTKICTPMLTSLTTDKLITTHVKVSIPAGFGSTNSNDSLQDVESRNHL